MKITCVMPTRDRHAFIPGAVKCFLEQDYPGDLDLIILDDSPHPLFRVTDYPDAIASRQNRQIRWKWQDPAGKPASTGAKRNAVNYLAHDADVIIHWDDDDWSHPSRVTTQIEFLLASGKHVVGYHSLLYWDTKSATGYRYDDPTFRPHAAGSSLCYYRDHWLYFNKFQDREVAEDFVFCVMANRNGNLASQDGGQMLVARSHGANTCTPNFGTKKYPQVGNVFPQGFLLTLQPQEPIITK